MEMPVGEAGGDVDVDRRAVDQTGEAFSRLRVFGDDGVGVVRGVRGDVPDGLVRVGDDLDCKDVIEEFRVKIPFARGRAGDDGLRRGVEVIFDPARIVVIVVIAELDEIRRVSGPPHLAERCGRLRRHLCRQRVDHAQLRGEELGSTLSVAARGIVKDDDAAVLPRLPLPRGVGVQGKVKVKAAEAVRLRDGRGRGHLRRVARERDGVCVKVRLERVGQQIHPVFLAATAVDIRVPILRGGTQINSGHVQNLPSFPVYA